MIDLPTRAQGHDGPCNAEAVTTRVLYVASTRHYGGLEVASIRLAELVTRTRPDIKIVFACRPGQPVERRCHEIGIPTTPLTIRNSGDLHGVRELISLVLRENIDIIHVHSRRDYVIAVLAVAKLRKMLGRDNAPKLMLHMHLLRPLGSPTMVSGYFFAPNVDLFLAVSDAVRNYLLRKHRQLNADRVVVVPNSVETDNFRIDPKLRDEIRRRYGIPKDAIVAGMVGRLDTKGQIEAIAALGHLNRQDVYLMLVGEAGKKGYLRRLKTRAQHLNISARVVFCGAQHDIAAHLSAMDLFVHLPRDEAFGLAPAEAMSAGLPVLVSNVGGCVELVTDGETGLVTGATNRAEIRAKLAALIDSPDLRQRLAAAGSDYIQARFTPKAQADTLIDLYDRVLQVDAVTNSRG